MKFINLFLELLHVDILAFEVVEKFEELLISCDLVLFIEFGKLELGLFFLLKRLIYFAFEDIGVVTQDFGIAVIEILQRLLAVFDIF